MMKKLGMLLLCMMLAASMCIAEEAAVTDAAVQETAAEETAVQAEPVEEAAQEPQEPYKGYRLIFSHKEFHGGQMLNVYSGPGRKYYRGAKGYAKADTDEEVYAAGMEKGWILVMYNVNSGGMRVGYVNSDELKYSTSELHLSRLKLDYLDAQITKACVFTDDPGAVTRTIMDLESGAQVTYLGRFSKLGNWAYIETLMDGQPVRGFVPEDCVKVLAEAQE